MSAKLKAINMKAGGEMKLAQWSTRNCKASEKLAAMANLNAMAWLSAAYSASNENAMKMACQ
jgi:hypothetical protein